MEEERAKYRGNPLMAPERFQRAAKLANLGAHGGYGNAAAFDDGRAAMPGEETDSGVMTVNGTVIKAVILLLVALGAAMWPWTVFFGALGAAPDPAAFGAAAAKVAPFGLGILGGLVLALIICFKPRTAPYLAVPYAFCEGVALGAFSAFFEAQYPGVSLQAVAGTFGVLLVMLACYTLGIIRPSAKFRAILTSAVLGVMLFYLVSMVLGWLGWMPGVFNEMLYGHGWLGIGFSVLVCGLASFCLIDDFGMVEQGAASRAPKAMEWYAAFGLLVTLVWLYLEILKLLVKLRGRD